MKKKNILRFLCSYDVETRRRYECIRGILWPRLAPESEDRGLSRWFCQSIYRSPARLSSMSDGLVSQITIAKLLVKFMKLSPSVTRPIHSATYEAGPKTRKIRQTRDRNNALRRSHETSSDGMGSVNLICSQERRLPPTLRRLPQTKSCNQPLRLSNSTHGRKIDLLGEAAAFSTIDVSSEY